MQQSLRTVLADFERTGDVHHVEREVDVRYELGAVLSLRGRGPAQMFHDVVGHDVPVVGNVLNTREKIARGLGVERRQVQRACITALDHGFMPEVVSEGPVQEIVHDGPVDIPSLLPIPTWFEEEHGPYITAGVVIAKDPETGRRNVSIARQLVLGGDRLMAGIAPTHHLSELMRRAHARGEPLEIAIVIGNHPAVLIASQMYVELGYDEYTVACGLLGEPLRLVPCKTVDLEVPAEAEIVLEGTLHADEQIDEGPVSEFPGLYVVYGQGNGVHIKAITRRSDAIFQAIMPGPEPEHHLLGATAIGATTCRALQQMIPNIRQVLITEGGAGRLHAIITMHQPKPGEGKRAVMMAMGQTNLLKLVIVVDDDVDPEDWNQVEWAMASRMDGERDIMIIPGVKADRCDPQERDRTVTKVGIVATREPGTSVPGDKFGVARVPHKVLEKVQRDLKSY